jgi:hypothetical protein
MERKERNLLTPDEALENSSETRCSKAANLKLFYAKWVAGASHQQTDRQNGNACAHFWEHFYLPPAARTCKGDGLRDWPDVMDQSWTAYQSRQIGGTRGMEFTLFGILAPEYQNGGPRSFSSHPSFPLRAARLIRPRSARCGRIWAGHVQSPHILASLARPDVTTKAPRANQ